MAAPGGAKRAGVAFVGVPETPAPERTGSQLAADLLLYTNPPLTYAAAAVGAAALAGAWFALRGAHGLTLLTGG